MEKIELDVVGISSSQSQAGTYALILAEKEGNRRIPIIIGAYEAQAIAIELEKMRPQRPLTHDLFKSFAFAHKITVSEVLINKFHDGVFYAEIHSRDSDNNLIITDARTSDAIALALRFGCPVYTLEAVISQTGIPVNPDPEEEDEDEPAFGEMDQPAVSLEDFDLEKLESMLEEAVNGENYELASQIRDEINRRKSKHE